MGNAMGNAMGDAMGDAKVVSFMGAVLSVSGFLDAVSQMLHGGS